MVRRYFIFLISSILFGEYSFAQNDSVYDVHFFKTLPNISIRALEAVSDTKAWFAANSGVWGYTEDAGKTWHIDSIKVDSVYPQFRSIAVLNDSTVLILSIASPAYVFKTTNKGKTWRLVYKNTDKNIFFDCMKFSDSKHGIAIGDPIGGAFQFIHTKNAGEKWTAIDFDGVPIVDSGEACFAASNTNLLVSGNHIRWVSGGKNSRIFHSSDAGAHFTATNSPLPKGEQMTGIFSMDFYNTQTGVIAGGNYVKADTSIVSMAYTINGGKTWTPLKSKVPVFGSCVQFITEDEFFVTGSAGTFHCDIKTSKITEIKDKNGASLKFNTLRFSPSKKTLWLAGSNGSIALLKIKK